MPSPTYQSSKKNLLEFPEPGHDFDPGTVDLDYGHDCRMQSLIDCFFSSAVILRRICTNNVLKIFDLDHGADFLQLNFCFKP